MTYCLPSDTDSEGLPGFADAMSGDDAMTGMGPHQGEASRHIPFTSEPRKKVSKWPTWNGEPSTFPFFLHLCRAKIEVDRAQLGPGKAICLDLVAALPEEKRPRVSFWFERGGDDGLFRVDGFLDHIKELFEDKQARQAAGRQLARITMGSQQHFADFLHDFEFKLSQCNGLGWADSAKIIQLNAAINKSLRAQLINKNLPDDDYTAWVNKVKRVAGRLEDDPSY